MQNKILKYMFNLSICLLNREQHGCSLRSEACVLSNGQQGETQTSNCRYVALVRSCSYVDRCPAEFGCYYLTSRQLSFITSSKATKAVHD